MKFTHLVEINDPLNPLIIPLTREQLWRGLQRRARLPQEFVPWLDRCTILEATPTSLRRELHFGELVVRDEVTFYPQQQVHYQVPAQNEISASTLTMTIEEPQSGVLLVRFEYDDGASEAADADNALYDDYRRCAYQEADIDTIRLIRQMAEDDLLNDD